MFTKLLAQSINKNLMLQSKNLCDFNSVTNRNKLKSVVDKLVIKATEINQPISLLIHMYAYFYTNVFKINRANMIVLKLEDFLQKAKFDDIPKLSNNDIETAYELENAWNSMHKLSFDEMPFQVRKFMGKSKISILNNTFFKHSREFHYFCIVAKFVNAHKSIFPQIHSYKEFFLHLPIVKKWPREYYIYQFTNCNNSLEKYYNMVYGNIAVNDRLVYFLSTLTADSLTEIQQSKIWCKQEAMEYIGNSINNASNLIAIP